MRIKDFIADSPIAAVITDPRQDDNPIVACNAAFEALTGYGEPEILGRNCRFLARGAVLLRDEIRAAVAQKRPLLAQVENWRKDGTPFRNALMIVPLFDEAGELEYFLGSQARADNSGQSTEAGARKRLNGLSVRQRAVLGGVVRGQRNKQIAHELGIAERTVKLHRAALLKALGVKTSAEAIRLAVEAGETAS